MCEICDQLKEMGRAEGRIEGLEEGELIGISKGEIIGMEKGYASGRTETMKETAENLLMKKLGYLSRNIVIKINASNEDVLNELIINIFDTDNEEDILRYVH